MAKPARVRTASGTWADLAPAVADLSNYSTTTQMNTAISAAAPMTLISSGTYSGVAAVNLSNSLSSTYKIYRLIFQHYGSVANYTGLKFRENTTDKTSGYFWGGAGGNYLGSSWNPASGGSGASYFDLAQYGASIIYQAVLSVDIVRPDATCGVITGTGFGDWDNRAYTISGVNRSMTNFNGLSITTSSGTITGSYKLYGYN